MTDQANRGRRKLLRGGIYAAAALPFAGLLPVTGRAQEELPKLSLDNPQAKSLKYVHDASKAGAPRQEGQICGNCALYQGDGEAQWGKCQIFPGKLVNRDGWCISYAPVSS